MRDISARELKGHKILAVERFWDNTRWMIEFFVLRPCTAYDRSDQLRYGSYENVLLSDTEYGKLRQEFPGDYQMRVERLSEYMASTGRSYKNHLATIRSWAKREKPKYNPADYTFEEGDSL